MARPSDLCALRDGIDRVDAQILVLLGERAELVRQIGKLKRHTGLPIYDPERERQVVARLTEQAPQAVDPEFVQRVFERIIDESRRLERDQPTLSDE